MATSVIVQNEQLEKQNKVLAEEVKMKEELIPGMEKMIAYLQKIQAENKQLKEENKKLKELYEAQQQETDIEHQRYLKTAEKYSDKLWEVCQELDIENDDTSKNIIEAIKTLKEQNENKKVEEK